MGSPPRMRGKPLFSALGGNNSRITPADAGKTVVFDGDSSYRQDHPRGCGENRHFDSGLAAEVGSPPRMRGKHAHRQKRGMRTGITPADAGKTLKRSFRNQPFCS